MPELNDCPLVPVPPPRATTGTARYIGSAKSFARHTTSPTERGNTTASGRTWYTLLSVAAEIRVAKLRSTSPWKPLPARASKNRRLFGSDEGGAERIGSIGGFY